MKATLLDLRRRMGNVVKALERGEDVTLLRRGKTFAVIRPAGRSRCGPKRVTDHPAFGMWTGRKDLADIGTALDRLRKGRFDAL